MKLKRRHLLRGLALVGVAIAAAWGSGVRVLAYPGESMVPAVRPGDHLLALVGWWVQGAPQRFDLLIFDVPPTSPWAARKIPWMKRLVGLPGEHVRLSAGELFINGRKIEANPLHSTHAAKAAADFELQLGPDEFCVLGDNLDRSFEDSRSLGPISRSLIRGRVAWVIHH